MEIRRLKYFVRIAEDGSLTKAAGVLRIAQPALSRQIRLLEEELGSPFPGISLLADILAYLQRIGARPAFQRAVQKGEPGLTPNLT